MATFENPGQESRDRNRDDEQGSAELERLCRTQIFHHELSQVALLSEGTDERRQISMK